MINARTLILKLIETRLSFFAPNATCLARGSAAKLDPQVMLKIQNELVDCFMIIIITVLNIARYVSVIVLKEIISKSIKGISPDELLKMINTKAYHSFQYFY